MSAGVNVFTYGSLMYDAVWARVVRGQYSSVPARLSGFRRLAIRDETYPAVVPDADAEVLGRLWFDVSPDDVERLDRFEGSEYRRQAVPVTPLPARDATPGVPGGRAEGLPVQRSGCVSAHCYLWLDPARLLAQPWDESAFEREHLAGFAQRHGAPAAGSGNPAPDPS
jgi:gamma-glutamylcyclotransferase (GGCT)/AIG2-like uncharacterized protein YtfP